MTTPKLTWYTIHSLRFGEQETLEAVEFIHSEVRTQMDEFKTELNIKTTVVLTKEDKIDLIDRMDTIKSDLIDTNNKVRTELIVWIVGISLFQYFLIMVTRKFF